MKMFKKAASLVVCICLLVGVFSGCGSKKTSNSNEPVTLKVVLGGVGEMADSQMVWDEFNKKLAEFLPNTRVEFEVIPYADYGEKWKLMAAAQETVDLAWIGWMMDLNDEVHKGSFLPIDDLLKEAPGLTEEFPSWVLDLARVDGKCYAVPCYQQMSGALTGIKVQAELAEKYELDIETLKKTFAEGRTLTKKDFKPFDDYLAKLKEAGELRQGVSPSFLDYIAGAIGRLGSYGYRVAGNALTDWRDKDITVYDEITDFPGEIEFYELMNEWYKKGYIRKDILSVENPTADDGLEDGYVLWAGTSFKGDSETQTKKFGYPILSVPLFNCLNISAARPSTNMGIPATAQDPVRSIKLLELLNTEKGKELYNLLVFGIEGVHYKKVSEDKIEWLDANSPGSSVDNRYGYDAWAIGNTFNAYETQFDVEGWKEYIETEVNEQARKNINPLIGFTVDINPIKLELAQYSAIMKEYEYVRYGANDNYKELLKERNEKLKKCGSDKIVKEVRKQIKEWKKTNK